MAIIAFFVILAVLILKITYKIYLEIPT